MRYLESAEHEKNIYVSSIKFFGLLISPILTVGLYSLLVAINGVVDKPLGIIIYELGLTEDGKSNWVAIVSALATVVIAQNVIFWDISKMVSMDHNSKREYKIINGRRKNSIGLNKQKTLEYQSYNTIAYGLSLLVSIVFLIVLSLAIISTFSQDKPAFIIGLLLYLVCCLNFYISIERSRFTTFLKSPKETNRSLLAAGQEKSYIESRFYLSIWRLLFVTTLFVLFISSFDNIYYILFSILFVLIFLIFLRNIFGNSFFTPIGSIRVLYAALSFMYPLIAFMPILSLLIAFRKEETVSLLRQNSATVSLSEALNSTPFSMAFLIILYVLLYWDGISYVNFHQATFLRYRAVNIFSNKKFEFGVATNRLLFDIFTILIFTYFSFVEFVHNSVGMNAKDIPLSFDLKVVSCVFIYYYIVTHIWINPLFWRNGLKVASYGSKRWLVLFIGSSILSSLPIVYLSLAGTISMVFIVIFPLAVFGSLCLSLDKSRLILNNFEALFSKILNKFILRYSRLVVGDGERYKLIFKDRVRVKSK